MTFAPTPALSPASTPIAARGRRAVRRAAGVASAALTAVALGGCGGAGQTPPPNRPDRATVPTTAPTVTTRPVTRPTTAATQIADLPPIASATQPATLPGVEAGVTGVDGVDGSDTTTAPTTAQAVAEAAGPREADLLLVENPTDAGRALAAIFETFGAGTLLDESAAASRDLALQGEALLTVAARLAPGDARLARQLVEARLRVGDAAGGLEALAHYRDLKPQDSLAQIRYVDLAGDGMQSADEKLDYLSRVAESDRVADDVRSHAAAMSALLLRETLDYQGADAMVRRAVELDPYNPLALQLDYERLLATGSTRAQRAGSLALLARSNPAQPAVLARLGEESLAAGLGEQANDYYSAALRAYGGLNVPPPARTVLDAAAVKIVTNRPREATPLVAAVAGRQAAEAASEGGAGPDFFAESADVGLLALLADRATLGQPQARANAEAMANSTRAGALAGLHNELNGLPAPEPLAADAEVPPTPLPDVVADAQKLADPQASQGVRDRRGDYAVTLSELAWIDLYFLEQPTDAAILRALELIVPEQSATLVRLRGWQLWRQNQEDAAAEKLATVGDRDPLARLGLLLMGRPATSQPAGTDAPSVTAQMQELLDAAPGGVVGAILADALRGRGVLLRPGEDAAAVRQALSVFEPRLLRVLRPENVGEFYSLDARPDKVRHEFGEPMLITVTLRNKGRDVLTVGPDGLVRSKLRLDARVTGGAEAQSVRAAAEPEWTGGTMVRPNEKLEQTVRLDGPRLSGLLDSLPQQRLTVNAEVTSNPIVAQTEQGLGYATAAAGMTAAAARLVDRSAVPLNLGDEQVAAELNAKIDQLRSGDGLERLRAAQLVLGQIRWISGYLEQQQQAGAAAEQLRPLQQLGGRLFDALQRAAGAYGVPQGGDAAATAWLKYAAAVTAEPGRRADYLRQLLESPAFESRAVGLLATATLVSDAADVEALIGPLAESDPDPTVRRLAQSQLRYVRARPATRPQTDATEQVLQ